MKLTIVGKDNPSDAVRRLEIAGHVVEIEAGLGEPADIRYVHPTIKVKVDGKEIEPECKHHEGLAPGLVEARRAIDAARRLPRVSKPDLDGQGQRWDAMAPSTAHKIDFQKAIESIDLCDGPHGPRKPHNHSFGE